METCGDAEMKSAFSSSLMFFNHCFILLIIAASFVQTLFAVRKLLNHNVLPTCTNILLWSAIINGTIHQLATAEIRIRAIINHFFLSSDDCLKLFPSSDCFFDGLIYFSTNLFSSSCCLFLFLDRLIALKTWKFYNRHQVAASIIFIIVQLISIVVVLIYVFHDSPYTAYIPICHYVNREASEKFHYANGIRIFIILIIAIFSSVLNHLNVRREKRMIHSIYNTNSRYQSYENFLATQAVYIIITQIFCVGTTAFISSQLNAFRYYIHMIWFYTINAFMVGLTYSNFILPFIIIYQTNCIIRKRKALIAKLQKKKEDEDVHHFVTLTNSWNAKFDRIHTPASHAGCSEAK